MENQSAVWNRIKNLYAMSGAQEELDETPYKAEDAHEWNCEESLPLDKDKHLFYLMNMFKVLPRGMVGQDSGQPWFLYWLTNGVEVCNKESAFAKLTPEMKQRACAYLRRCHNDVQGGFSGAPGLESHLASTYAAVLAIVNIGTKEAYDIIDRQKMRTYLCSLKNNLDLTHSQDPNNAWAYSDKTTGEPYSFSGCSEVLGT